MWEIRTFKDEDRADLAEIYLNCRAETFNWVSRSHFNLEDFAKDTEGEKILVAVNTNGIAGFISLWMADNFIHHLYVSRNFQGSGIGEQLLNAGMKMILKPARLKCVAQNTRARAFYEKRGWTIESSGEDSLTGRYYTYIHL